MDGRTTVTRLRAPIALSAIRGGMGSERGRFVCQAGRARHMTNPAPRSPNTIADLYHMRASHHKIPNVKDLFGCERPCSVPAFRPIWQFSRECIGRRWGAPHTRARVASPHADQPPELSPKSRGPQPKPSAPKASPRPRTRNKRKYGRDATLAQHRQLRALARRAPRRTVRPFEIATPPDPAFDRVSSRVLAGPPRREREYASRRDERTPPHLTREIPPRR